MTDQATVDTRAQYWKAQIDAWQASGQSQQAFCKVTGHSAPLLLPPDSAESFFLFVSLGL